MRLIDADAFDERVRVAGGMSEEELTEDFKDGVQAVLYMLSNQPTIQPEPHWIPVTERLPETDDEVLTTYIVNGNRKKRYVETSRYYYDGFSGYWSSPWDEYRIAGTRIEVIAWMPLPEPYKGVTDGRD